jgi:two-component system, chemotaxis family, sensor kinase CheA
MNPSRHTHGPSWPGVALPGRGAGPALRQLFLDEAVGHIAAVEVALETLGRAVEQPTRLDAAAEMLRHLHTLKGAAGSVGLDSVGEAAHELEELCTEIHENRLEPTLGILEQVDEALGTLGALVAGARAPLATQDSALDRRMAEFDGALAELDRTRAGLSELRRGLDGDVAVAPPATRRAFGHRLAELEAGLGGVAERIERAARGLGGEVASLCQLRAAAADELSRTHRTRFEEVFNRLPSVLEELEENTGHAADLALTGGAIEVDRGLADQIAEALLHLLRNAMAHGIETPTERRARGKSTRGRIEVAVREEGDNVVVSFSDDGRGLDREEIRRALVRRGRLGANEAPSEATLIDAIFEAGFSSRPIADRLAGRGLGLNIVKRAALAMGGDVRVEDAPGEGTRFIITAPNPARPDGDARPARRPAPLPQRQPAVLVVDDSRLQREGTARALLEAGITAVTATDGLAAWELLAEQPFDALVTDLEMPRLDGFELIARIRADARLCSLPVIVVSSRIAQPPGERALAAGADAILPKARHSKALLGTITALVARENGRDGKA